MKQFIGSKQIKYQEFTTWSQGKYDQIDSRNGDAYDA